MRPNSRAWNFTAVLIKAQPPCMKGFCNVDRRTREMALRHRYHEIAVVLRWVYVSGGRKVCVVYQIGNRSVLCIYFIRCVMLRYRLYACWAWVLICAVVRDQLLCVVPFIVLLKLIPSIRMSVTKSTPKSFTVPFHSPIRSVFNLGILSHSPEAFS
jgi:hypothetical protein